MSVINLFPSEIAKIDDTLYSRIGQFTPEVYSWPRRLSSVFATKSMSVNQGDGPDQRQNILYFYLDIGDGNGEWEFLSPLYLYEDHTGNKYVESTYKKSMGIIVMEFRFFMSIEECSLLIHENDKYINCTIDDLRLMGYLRAV